MLSNAPQTLTLSQIVLQFGKDKRLTGDWRVPLYNEVLQFARDDEIKFGGRHLTQVLLARDRRLTRDWQNLTHITIEVKMLL
uniref:Uncharacterized protein n=1 Tax=Oryza punctata TaxID=4537 RepID=A0A0E0LK62_ORYPU